ncbi:MAG: acyl-CoA carboxylase subunit beta [Elusimicrobiota bacterium]
MNNNSKKSDNNHRTPLAANGPNGRRGPVKDILSGMGTEFKKNGKPSNGNNRAKPGKDILSGMETEFKKNGKPSNGNNRAKPVKNILFDMRTGFKKNGKPSNGNNRPEKDSAPPCVQRSRAVRLAAIQGASLDRIEAQRAKGKLTARERVHYLLDEHSFQEIGLLVKTRSHDFDLQEKASPGDGVITGFGKIRGRRVAVFAQDFTVLGGTIGLAHAQKVARLMDAAYDARIPLISLMDSGGARIQEGVHALDGYAEIFSRNVKASGVIPQISIILGPCAGGAVYSAALTDFVFMVEGLSHMFITGPQVVREATGESIDFETLGGSETHAVHSGVCHFLAKSESDCFRQVRELLTFLPQSRWSKAPHMPSEDTSERDVPFLEELCGLDPRRTYPIHDVIHQLADESRFLETQSLFAKNLTTGFMRLDGEVVGVVANNPAHLAGALDINASEKAARFVRFLNNFNIPILTLVDVPGYLPGLEQERGGIIRRGAKLLYAYCEATVPKISVVLRKAYGGAYIAMGSKLLRGDLNFALPSAEIAVMGSKGAVEILFGKRIKASPSPEDLWEDLARDYSDRFASPYQAASSGSLDDVVEPRRLRSKLILAFEVLRDKRQPGQGSPPGNIPL